VILSFVDRAVKRSDGRYEGSLIRIRLLISSFLSLYLLLFLLPPYALLYFLLFPLLLLLLLPLILLPLRLLLVSFLILICISIMITLIFLRGDVKTQIVKFLYNFTHL